MQVCYLKICRLRNSSPGSQNSPTHAGQNTPFGIFVLEACGIETRAAYKMHASIAKKTDGNSKMEKSSKSMSTG